MGGTGSGRPRLRYDKGPPIYAVARRHWREYHLCSFAVLCIFDDVY